MGGSSRRQRSTSETRRRIRQCSTRRTDEEDQTTTSIHGLSPYLWILATSALIVVYSPPTSNNPFSNTPYFPISTEKLILNDLSPSALKMDSLHYGYEQYDQQQPQQMEIQKNEFPEMFRPRGLRYRGDETFMRMLQERQQQQNSYRVMPVLTEHQPSHSFGMPSTSSHQGTSYGEYTSQPSPSLEDLDLIDCMWRNDAALEKGTPQVLPADQYERDLQMLNQKSAHEQLTEEENRRRYEEMSKEYYAGFYENFIPQKYASEQTKSSTLEHTPEPQDQDLEDLLKDVSNEESELNKVFENKNPVLNNVSLSEAIGYTNANFFSVTEQQEMQDMCNQLDLNAVSSQPATLFNETDAQTDEMWQQTNTRPEHVFPPSTYMTLQEQNATGEPVTSNGSINFDHGYTTLNQPPFSQLDLGLSSSTNGRQQQTQTSPNSATVTATATHSLFVTYHDQRNSMSDYTTDSSSPCSRSSQSPAYEAHDFRMDGKLMPRRDHQDYSRSSPSRSNKINRVMNSNGQRKRGRQSKDEQLAQDHGLPVSALEISEMSLSELQNVLKMDDLSEYQRQLIRKIRRRGKNKVAARTCRQRRTDRHEKVSMSHYI